MIADDEHLRCSTGAAICEHLARNWEPSAVIAAIRSVAAPI